MVRPIWDYNITSARVSHLVGASDTGVGILHPHRFLIRVDFSSVKRFCCRAEDLSSPDQAISSPAADDLHGETQVTVIACPLRG